MRASLSLQGEDLEEAIATNFQHWLGRHSERKRNRLGKNQEALDALIRVETLDPRNVDYIYTRATILRDMERYQDALETVREAEKLAPGAPLLLQFRSSLHKALGQEAEAKAAWQQYRQAEALQRLQSQGGIPGLERP